MPTPYSMMISEGKVNNDLRKVAKEKSAFFENSPSIEKAGKRLIPDLIKIEFTFESGMRLLMSDYHMIRLMQAYLKDKGKVQTPVPGGDLESMVIGQNIEAQIKFYEDEIATYQEALTNIMMIGYRLLDQSG